MLKQLAKGTPSIELRTEGPGILDVGVDAKHNRYLIHNVKGELEIIDRSSKELIGIIPNVRSVAGLDSVGDHYLGVNSNAVFSKWNTTSPFTEETFSNCPENLYLIGHNSKQEVFAIELSETPRVVKTNHGKNLSIIDVLTGEHLSNHWEFFKGSVGRDSTIACFWVNRRGVFHDSFCLLEPKTDRITILKLMKNQVLSGVTKTALGGLWLKR